MNECRRIYFGGSLPFRLDIQMTTSRHNKASGRVEYPNPKRKRGTISQVPHLRIGLWLVVFTTRNVSEGPFRRSLTYVSGYGWWFSHRRSPNQFSSDECSDDEELARTAYHEAGHCIDRCPTTVFGRRLPQSKIYSWPTTISSMIRLNTKSKLGCDESGRARPFAPWVTRVS